MSVRASKPKKTYAIDICLFLAVVCCVVAVVGKRRVEFIRRPATGGVSWSSSLSILATQCLLKYSWLVTSRVGQLQHMQTGYKQSSGKLCRRSRFTKGVAQTLIMYLYCKHGAWPWSDCRNWTNTDARLHLAETSEHSLHSIHTHTHKSPCKGLVSFQLLPQ